MWRVDLEIGWRHVWQIKGAVRLLLLKGADLLVLVGAAGAPFGGLDEVLLFALSRRKKGVMVNWLSLSS